jgi:hypothetical protein
MQHQRVGVATLLLTIAAVGRRSRQTARAAAPLLVAQAMMAEPDEWNGTWQSLAMAHGATPNAALDHLLARRSLPGDTTGIRQRLQRVEDTCPRAACFLQDARRRRQKTLC